MYDRAALLSNFYHFYQTHDMIRNINTTGVFTRDTFRTGLPGHDQERR